MSNIVLACRQLSKTYHDGTTEIRVLRSINLEVVRGEMLAIVGNSGCGKSTLLHLLAGLDQPSSGEVLLQNTNLHELNENERCMQRNRYLGFVYQFHHLLPEFSALENVSLPLLIAGQAPRLIREKSAHLLDQVGLAHRMQAKLAALSGGERQRVAIARALIAEPVCILADEPTGNLDPRNAERVLSLFVDLQKMHQTSVIIVTHDHLIAQQAGRMMRLHEGMLLAAD